LLYNIVRLLAIYDSEVYEKWLSDDERAHYGSLHVPIDYRQELVIVGDWNVESVAVLHDLASAAVVLPSLCERLF